MMSNNVNKQLLELGLSDNLSKLSKINTLSEFTDDQITVREFLPVNQTNASRSNLKAKFKRTPDSEELNGILSLISDNGELILKSKKINLIPRIFYHQMFESILILDIRNNEVTEIEDEICSNLPNIKKLDARNNKIKSISCNIKAMKQLLILRLDSNELCYLPNEIGELANLEELTFQDNKISTLPLQIGKL